MIAPSPHPTMLTKPVYLQIRDQLTFKPDLRIVVATVVVNQSLFALGLWLLQQGSWLSYSCAQLIFPIVFFQAFSLLHDCGHGSCLPSSRANAVLGHLASVLCLMPYFPWKYQHALHHAWTGVVDKDPTLRTLLRIRSSGKVPLLLRLAWRSWLPLMAALQHIVFWSHPIDVWRARIRWQFLPCLFSVAWLAIAYTTLHALAPQLFNIANFAPAIVIYLCAVEMVNLPHHADRPLASRKLPAWEQGYSTRSCY